MKIGKVILPFLLVTQTVYCWNCFYQAQFLQYDDNYGLLLHSFFIACTTFLILTIMVIRIRHVISQNKMPIIIWAVFGSPFTYIIAAINYNKIFGTYLAS